MLRQAYRVLSASERGDEETQITVFNKSDGREDRQGGKHKKKTRMTIDTGRWTQGNTGLKYIGEN